MLKEYIWGINWINISQLQSLGISEETFFTLFIFLGILGCYFIIRPIALILISLKSERLLNYILSGLAFIVIFFTVVLWIGDIEMLTYELFKISLQVLAMFGLVLCVIHLFKRMKQRRKKV